MTMPRPVLVNGGQVAVALAARSWPSNQPCVCRHARKDHLNRGRCLGYCDCRAFTLPDPEPEPEAAPEWDGVPVPLDGIGT